VAEWKAIKVYECPECGEFVRDMNDACGHKCKNTPEEKITALVEHIKKEFPNGCDDVECSDCPLNFAEYYSTKRAVCEMLRCMAHIRAGL